MRITKALNIRIPNASNGYVQLALQNLFAANGLDFGAYGCLIQHCNDHGLFRQGKQLHARLALFSVTPNNFLAAKLITLYSKSNHLREARNLFDKIPSKNIFSWNALLIGYSLNNMHLDTLKLFLSLVSSNLMDVKPDCYTISCALKALSSLFSHSRLAKEVHCFVLRRGLELDIFVLNAWITQYSRCDEIGFARTVFDRMLERDIVSWNSMIAGYSQAGEMLGLAGLWPNGMTIVSVLQACGQSKDLSFGMEVHRFINENQIDIDVSVCNAIIGLYAKCGSLDYARELFDEMSEKDEVTYGSIISGYMVNGFIDNAMDLFQEMKKPGLSTWNAVISGLVQNNRHEGVLDLVLEMQACGFKPNTVTISSILPTISYLSKLKGGKKIHAYAVRNSYDSNIYVATAIIDTYAKSGFLHGAKWIFDQSKGKSLIIWTAIISAYAAHGDANTALGLFNDMLNDGIRPDPITFTAVLAACAHSGVVEEAWKIFDAMFMKYGIQPSVEHYACMVGVLSRAGRLSEAVEFVSKMPIETSAKVWGALLNGACVSGDVVLGKFVCDNLFEIEPENTGNYIIMANLYSQAGR
ncbi:pentatricopeptide repeat-containing protein At2g37310 [Fagus crenata]